MHESRTFAGLFNAILRPRTSLRAACSILFVAMVAALFYASAKPAGLPLIAPPLDKLVHFGYYAVLTMLLIVAAGGRGVLIAALVVIGVGAADELFQSTVPQRTADWLDFAADIVGALVAAAAFVWLARRARYLSAAS
ncbi:MAG: VanZ family protein [Burkholderiales bacterium]